MEKISIIVNVKINGGALLLTLAIMTLNYKKHLYVDKQLEIEGAQ